MANKLKCASRADQLSLVHPACYQKQCTSWFKVVSAEQNSSCTQNVNPEVCLLWKRREEAKNKIIKMGIFAALAAQC